MTHTLKRLGIRSVVALGLGLSAWTSAEAQSLTWLGTLGGNSSIGYDVSNNGVVVGAAQNAQGIKRAFRWTPATGMAASRHLTLQGLNV